MKSSCIQIDVGHKTHSLTYEFVVIFLSDSWLICVTYFNQQNCETKTQEALRVSVSSLLSFHHPDDVLSKIRDTWRIAESP